jgi:hypothetical protein
MAGLSKAAHVEQSLRRQGGYIPDCLCEGDFQQLSVQDRLAVRCRNREDSCPRKELLA